MKRTPAANAMASSVVRTSDCLLYLIIDAVLSEYCWDYEFHICHESKPRVSEKCEANEDQKSDCDDDNGHEAQDGFLSSDSGRIGFLILLMMRIPHLYHGSFRTAIRYEVRMTVR
jgi:hypothetical protein